MKLSLWIIREHLLQYHPKTSIQSGGMELTGVRILADTPVRTASNLYLARAQEFIDGETNRVICVHKQDWILLETEDIDQVFNEIMDCFDFYNQWEEICTTLVDQRGSLQELLEMSRGVFRDTLYVVDASFMILAQLDYPLIADAVQSDGEVCLHESIREEHSLPLEYISRVRCKNFFLFEPGKPRLDSVGNGITPNYVLGLFLNGQHLYNLIQVNYNTKSSTAKEQLLTVMGRLVEYWMEKNGDHDDYRKTMHRVFLDTFCETGPKKTGNLQDFQTFFDKLGWSGTEVKRLYFIKGPVGVDALMPAMAAKLNRHPWCLAEAVESQLVLFFNESMQRREQTDAILDVLLKETNCYAGAGYPFMDLQSLRSQILFGRTALRYGKSEPGCINRCEDYVAEYITNVLQQHIGAEFCHPAIHTILEYDQKHNSSLLATLKAFLLNERDYRLTAQEMYVHRNTIQHRIEKIQEITDLDFDQLQIRIHILISILICTNLL